MIELAKLYLAKIKNSKEGRPDKQISGGGRESFKMLNTCLFVPARWVRGMAADRKKHKL